METFNVHLKYTENNPTLIGCCKSISEDSASINSIGIIHHRLNYLTLGSIIALTKKHVDKVYVMLDSRDEPMLELVNSMRTEIIRLSDNGHISMLEKILRSEKENDALVLVTLYGDGTHDPSKIPELVDHVKNGESDVVAGLLPTEYNSYINKNVLFLNKGKSKKNHSGFMACSNKCLDTLKFYNNGKDITTQILIHAKNSNLKVKYLHFDTDQNFGILNLYKIGVVVPAYNEELLIEETIKGIPKYVNQIYVIDDCSTDRTPDIVKHMIDPRIVSVRHEKNRGVGAAIVTGYKLALEDEMDIVAVMAGDNQMDPEHLPFLLMPIIEERADYTKGNRLISKDFRSGMSKWRFLGNAMLTMITKIGCGYWHINDPQNGYTAISRPALEAMNLDAIYPYYGYCNDLLIKLNTFGMSVEDVIIPARYGREKSKIKYSKFILKVAPMIFRGFLWRLKTKYVVLDFHPLVFFYIASMMLLPAGVLFSLWILIQKIYHNLVSVNFPLLAVLIDLMGLQFLLFAMLFDMQADKSRSGTT